MKIFFETAGTYILDMRVTVVVVIILILVVLEGGCAVFVVTVPLATFTVTFGEMWQLRSFMCSTGEVGYITTQLPHLSKLLPRMTPSRPSPKSRPWLS